MATAREKAAAAGDLDAASRLRARPAAEASLWLVTDPALLETWNAAKQALPMAAFGGGGPETAARAELAVDEARRALEDAGAVQIVVRHAGRTPYRDLLDKHAPTEADHEELRKSSGNPKAMAAYARKTFVPALIDLSIVTPGVDAALLEELSEKGQVSEAEIIELFWKARDLYETSRVADLGK